MTSPYTYKGEPISKGEWWQRYFGVVLEVAEKHGSVTLTRFWEDGSPRTLTFEEAQRVYRHVCREFAE